LFLQIIRLLRHRGQGCRSGGRRNQQRSLA
jgi:hypothetical protein